ncbi:MAG: UvrD-helicase domain-containing protein [Acidobacteriota bacterium]
MNATILPDADQRRTAVITPDHAFVWASAGTGKTHTLTLRALYLLLSAPFLAASASQFPEVGHLYSLSDRRLRLRAARTAIRSLVLTTFTRKAAAEMQTRLYAYLDLLASSPSRPDLAAAVSADGRSLDPLFEEICDELCRKLGRGADPELGFERLRLGAQALAELACDLQISTIHSLAAGILQRHPLQSGIPATARFAEENEDDYGDLDDALIRRWWQTEGLSDPDLEQGLEKLLARVSPYHIREWFKKIYHNPEIIDQLEGWASPDPVQTSLALAACIVLGEDLRRNNGKKIAANGQRLVELASALQALENEGHPTRVRWSELCNFLHENRSTLFLDSSYSQKAVKSAIQRLDPHLAVYFESLGRIYPLILRKCVLEELGLEWGIWKTVLRRFLAWSKAKGVSAIGVVGFDEMIRLAADLLDAYPEVKRAERRRLRALLVDEFQDTDPEQLRLITGLLAKERPDDPEILGFFVGDTKQSIYRFRGADVDSTVCFSTSYASLTKCSLPVRNLVLASTFRSLPAITTLVNRLFSRELPLLRDDQEKLLPIRPDRGEPPEWVWIASEDASKPLTAAAARNLAAVETVRLISDFVNRDAGGSGQAVANPAPCSREGGHDPRSRKGSYSDILVLVRSGRELDALLPVLQEAGIPVVSSGARTLYRQPEVSDILNLLISLYNPLDTLAVGAVLRSPLVQISDPDIYRLIKTIAPSRIFHQADPLPGFLPEPARRRIEALRRLVQSRRSSSISAWLMQIRDFLPLAAYTDALDLEGRSYARINRLLEAFLAQMKADPSTALAWLLRQRSRGADAGRYDPDFGEDVGIADERIDAVRVMTIHKAKGLEARYVIVYGWSSVLHEKEAPAGQRAQAVIRSHSLARPQVEFSLSWGPVVVCSDLFQAAAKEEDSKARAEAVRLAYVATTRARDQLTLLCAVSRNTKLPEPFQPLWEQRTGGRAEAPGWDRTLIIRTSSAGAEYPRHTTPVLTLPDRDLYQALWCERFEKLGKTTDFPLARPSRIELSEPPSAAPGQKSLISDPVLTGQLVHSYLERWLLEDEFERDKLVSLWRRLERASDNVLRDAQSALGLFYADRLPAATRPSYRERVRNAKVMARELPFFMTSGGKFWNGVIDLVLEENGEILGVDYKTAIEKEQLPESYAQQAAVYTEALQQLFPGKPVRFEFWWLWDPAAQHEKQPAE